MKEQSQIATSPKQKFELKSFIRQKRIWLLGILLVLVGGGAFTAYRVLSAADPQTTTLLRCRPQ